MQSRGAGGKTQPQHADAPVVGWIGEAMCRSLVFKVWGGEGATSAVAGDHGEAKNCSGSSFLTECQQSSWASVGALWALYWGKGQS